MSFLSNQMIAFVMVGVLLGILMANADLGTKLFVGAIYVVLASCFIFAEGVFKEMEVVKN